MAGGRESLLESVKNLRNLLNLRGYFCSQIQRISQMEIRIKIVCKVG